jgi:hypothetical protein
MFLGLFMLVHVPFVGSDVKVTIESSAVSPVIPVWGDYTAESPYMKGP